MNNDAKKVVDLVNKLSMKVLKKNVAILAGEYIVLSYKDMKDMILTTGFSNEYLANRISTSSVGSLIFKAK